MAADIKSDAVELAERIRGYVEATALVSFIDSTTFAEKTAKMPATWVDRLHDEARDRWGDIVVPWSFDATGGAL